MYVISSIYGMLRGSNALQLCTLYGYVQRRIAIYTLVGASKKKKKKTVYTKNCGIICASRQLHFLAPSLYVV